MILGDIARKRLHFLTFVIAGLATVATPLAASAATEATAPAAAATTVADTAAPAAAAATVPVAAATAAAAPAGEGYAPLGQKWFRGVPKSGEFGFQPQFSPTGKDALRMHNVILMPIITAICILVLGLLLWVVVRYNRKANPVPSKTSHNTVIEVIWTLVPVIILGVIAFPSINLLSKQFESPPKDALTIKVTGYQWYWGYAYPDNGGFEVISNMLKEPGDVAAGERARTEDDGPAHLAADNRMVVPVGEPIRIQVIGADVIHAFGIPSLWFKIDAVPGRINEKTMTITEPGVYFGQCMELCGARHGYMPIAIEALPRPQFEAWVRSQGGTLAKPGAAAAAAAPAQAPASAQESAPQAGAAPAKTAA